MKNFFYLFIFIFGLGLSGCIVDVVEQNTERWAYANGKGVVSVYFDASIYREAFSVHGSALCFVQQHPQYIRKAPNRI